MKRIVGFVLMVLVSVGCATKDEKARTNISKAWKISKVFQNGTDVTASYVDAHENYRITFNNNGTFQEYFQVATGGAVNVAGSWVFSDGIRKVTLTDGNQTRVYSIDLLEPSNFNITDQGSTNNRQFLYVPN